MKSSFLFSLFLIVLSLNGYKLIDLASLIQENGPLSLGWKIYNWMPDGQISNSLLGWIFLHTLSGILHYFITLLHVLARNSKIGLLFNLSHWIFCLWILPSIFNFGEFPWYVALGGNGLPLSIMLLSWNDFWILRWLGLKIHSSLVWTAPWIYLAGLSTAPFFEVYSMIRHR